MRVKHVVFSFALSFAVLAGFPGLTSVGDSGLVSYNQTDFNIGGGSGSGLPPEPFTGAVGTEFVSVAAVGAARVTVDGAVNHNTGAVLPGSHLEAVGLVFVSAVADVISAAAADTVLINKIINERTGIWSGADGKIPISNS